jgi:hypothetical protein
MEQCSEKNLVWDILWTFLENTTFHVSKKSHLSISLSQGETTGKCEFAFYAANIFIR